MSEALGAVLGGLDGWPGWARSTAIVGTTALLAWLGVTIARAALLRLSGRNGDALRLVLHDTRWSTTCLAPLIAVYLTLPIAWAGPGMVPARRAAAMGLILALGWFAAGLVRAGEDFLLQRLRIDVRDNLRARKLHTQLRLLRRILFVGIGAFTLGSALFQFEEMRRLSTGLLAAAGVAGIVIGFAAQRTLGNLIAGIQIALTQPIRIDDVVIVEGEWGWIEEITLTYVVVRVWDQRRLVVPIQFFLEKAFQNWTRVSSDILATAFVFVDYRAPVDEIRAELGRILEKSDHWDGRVWRLHVSGANERTLQLRALMSAADSPTAWELHCEVRERLIGWIRDTHPDALPRVRAEIGDGVGDDRLSDTPDAPIARA